MAPPTTSPDAPAPSDWHAFRDAQREIVLPAGSVNHLDVTIRYAEAGPPDAPVILLLHGIPTWSFLYRHAIPPLAAAGYRVLAPDFLGHGFSDRRDRFDRSFRDQARMIVALLDALGVGNADVVGHDTGGAVALILAIEHARRVRRLVVCNAVCYDRFDDDMLDLGHPVRWKARPAADLRAFLEESLTAGLTDRSRDTPDFREGILAPWLDPEGRLSLLRNASALNANQTMALVDRHGAIAAPTLVLWGLDDPWQRAEDGRRLTGEIPGARFEGVAGASHWLQQDAPEAFAGAVLGFLGA